MWIISETGRAFNTDRILWFDIDNGNIWACEDSDNGNGLIFARKRNSEEAREYLKQLVAKLNAEETQNVED